MARASIWWSLDKADAFAGAKDEHIAVTQDDVSARFALARGTILVGVVSCVLAAIGFAVALSRGFARRVGLMTAAMRRLAPGDKAVEIPAIGRDRLAAQSTRTDERAVSIVRFNEPFARCAAPRTTTRSAARMAPAKPARALPQMKRTGSGGAAPDYAKDVSAVSWKEF
ncbi:hypothetical protein [Jiella mangrovi]|uniref:HAMP domain-containing protein n=1 Tax=Jiella mangrovi TaxID=2821407 RepID=A0ABS4BBN1_9HYPH|nr:hypothetical protein [Jiella mangrovi]MBP0614162.1 hypothetical protein [Jiella mangrovi]